MEVGDGLLALLALVGIIGIIGGALWALYEATTWTTDNFQSGFTVRRWQDTGPIPNRQPSLQKIVRTRKARFMFVAEGECLFRGYWSVKGTMRVQPDGTAYVTGRFSIGLTVMWMVAALHESLAFVLGHPISHGVLLVAVYVPISALIGAWTFRPAYEEVKRQLMVELRAPEQGTEPTAAS
jgi:hypothetical protein